MAEPSTVPVARFPAGPKVREWSRKHSFSDWMVARWVKTTDDPGRFLAGLQQKPPSYLRANPIRADAATLRKRLIARGFELQPTDLDPDVFRIHHAPISIGATHEHLLGMSMPQDLASASAPIALGAGSAETVVDLAAAPGVKSVHIANDMENAGTLVAVEPDEARMQALRFNLERCGVADAAMMQMTGQELATQTTADGPWADRILLDAPCTGEGTIPKDRNRRRGKPEEISKLAGLQQELTTAADMLLRPGGTLVYATCTFAPEENEAQVQRLIEMGYEVQSLPFDSCNGEPLEPPVMEWPGLELDDAVGRARRFVPGIHGTLGFFIAKLRKPVRSA